MRVQVREGVLGVAGPVRGAGSAFDAGLLARVGGANANAPL
jgi:hypothetical protein